MSFCLFRVIFAAFLSCGAQGADALEGTNKKRPPNLKRQTSLCQTRLGVKPTLPSQRALPIGLPRHSATPSGRSLKSVDFLISARKNSRRFASDGSPVLAFVKDRDTLMRVDSNTDFADRTDD
jgi:hypothetical protein